MSLSPADNTARAADIARAALNNHIILGTRAENTIPDFDTFTTPRYVTHNLAHTEYAYSHWEWHFCRTPSCA